MNSYKKIREMLNYTQGELSDIMDINKSTISKMENGRTDKKIYEMALVPYYISIYKRIKEIDINTLSEDDKGAGAVVYNTLSDIIQDDNFHGDLISSAIILKSFIENRQASLIEVIQNDSNIDTILEVAANNLAKEIEKIIGKKVDGPTDVDYDDYYPILTVGGGEVE